ncbi:MAG: hypothetical protein QM765_32810 [Myxococcales bacterium]
MSRLILFAMTAVSLLAGCTSVKVVQRDGCWVRQTKQIFSSKEELGPCGRPEPKWSDDRLTRVTQECVAQADYRWQSRALEAWSRGQPLPEKPPDDTVLEICMDEVSRSQLAENERLKVRVSELAADKDALADRSEKDRSHLLAGYEKMAGDLGMAARRPSPPAIATATAKSEGRTTSEGRSSSDQDKEPRVVAALPVAVPAQPLATPTAVATTPPPPLAKKPAGKPPSTPPANCPPVSDTAVGPPGKLEKTSAKPEPTPGP